MSFVLLNAGLVEAIHDAALNPGELLGTAGDKSLEGALARVDNRLVYGMITDAFDLAAAYCVAVASGHVFQRREKTHGPSIHGYLPRSEWYRNRP